MALGGTKGGSWWKRFGDEGRGSGRGRRRRKRGMGRNKMGMRMSEHALDRTRLIRKECREDKAEGQVTDRGGKLPPTRIERADVDRLDSSFLLTTTLPPTRASHLSSCSRPHANPSLEAAACSGVPAGLRSDARPPVMEVAHPHLPGPPGEGRKVGSPLRRTRAAPSPSRTRCRRTDGEEEESRSRPIVTNCELGKLARLRCRSAVA